MSPMLAATETNRIAVAGSGETFLSGEMRVAHGSYGNLRVGVGVPCAPQFAQPLLPVARRGIGDALTRYRYIQYPSHAIARRA